MSCQSGPRSLLRNGCAVPGASDHEGELHPLPLRLLLTVRVE